LIYFFVAFVPMYRPIFMLNKEGTELPIYKIGINGVYYLFYKDCHVSAYIHIVN